MFDLDYEIKPREIIFSIAIIAAMLTFGVVISQKIGDAVQKKSIEVIKSIQIYNDHNLYVHCMNTDYGNALVYSEIRAIEPVDCYEYGGSYMAAKREYQVYRNHPETVYEYDEDGNVIGSHEEDNWQWDTDDVDEKFTSTINFCGETYSYGMIYVPTYNYLGCENIGYHERYLYYATPMTIEGTLFADLSNKNIQVKKFYPNKTIDNVVQKAKENANGTSLKILFWFVWILLTGGLVYGFYILDNKWLESN